MTHFIECEHFQLTHGDSPKGCICEYLSDKPYFTGKRVGYLFGLEAAKLGLLQLETDMSNWSSEETRAATDVFPKLTCDQWMWAQYGVGRSLQVIRVLIHNRTENGTTMTEAD
jgi:hypothetical protein